MNRQTIITRIDRAPEVPTLPTLLAEIDRRMQQPDVTLRQLGQVIGSDQAMATKLLRLANSAFYGCSSPVTELQGAMALMGFNTVRNAVLSISVVRAFHGFRDLEGFRMEDFWRHAVGVAITSRFLARETKWADPEEAFVGGLIHDIGKIVIAQLFPGLFSRVWRCICEQKIDFFEAERRTLPVNHAVAGARLSLRWRLPGALTETIRRHHRADNRMEPPLVQIVALADRLVNSPAAAADGPTHPVLGIAAPEPLHRMISCIDRWYPGLQQIIADATGFFLDMG
jgi:putative nucleotidyltransferase with HDIG domain